MLSFKPYLAEVPPHVGSKPIEIVQAQYGLETIAKLSSNESPLGPSPQVTEVIQTLAGTLNHYPDFTDNSLRQALADKIGHNIIPDQFITGNGACDVLMMIAEAFLEPGDEYIIARPTFPIYENINRKTGARAIYADLTEPDFHYDIAAMVQAITSKTKLIYLCSPNNPTGGIISAEAMDRLIQQLPDHVLLITDEVYHHFVTASDYPNSLSYVQQGKNVVIIHSFSKAYGLAGLRLGYAITTPPIADYVSRFRQPYHINKLTLAGGITALQDQSHVQQTVNLVLQGRMWLASQLVAFQLPIWPSEANFILFKPPFSSVSLSEQLKQRGVMVRPMTGFYLPDYMRVSVGLPEENQRFIQALAEILHA